MNALDVLNDVADQIASIASPNCELRYDGTEDPTTAAWVNGLRDAHTVVLQAIVELGGGPS